MLKSHEQNMTCKSEVHISAKVVSNWRRNNFDKYIKKLPVSSSIAAAARMVINVT